MDKHSYESKQTEVIGEGIAKSEMEKLVETSNFVGGLMVASANPGMANHPWKGVVKPREPFKFWWAPTIFLERLIVSDVVNLDGRSVW